MAFIHLLEIAMVIQGICNRITYQYDKFIDFYKYMHMIVKVQSEKRESIRIQIL